MTGLLQAAGVLLALIALVALVVIAIGVRNWNRKRPHLSPQQIIRSHVSLIARIEEEYEGDRARWREQHGDLMHQLTEARAMIRTLETRGRQADSLLATGAEAVEFYVAKERRDKGHTSSCACVWTGDGPWPRGGIYKCTCGYAEAVGTIERLSPVAVSAGPIHGEGVSTLAGRTGGENHGGEKGNA